MHTAHTTATQAPRSAAVQSTVEVALPWAGNWHESSLELHLGLVVSDLSGEGIDFSIFHDGAAH